VGRFPASPVGSSSGGLVLPNTAKNIGWHKVVSNALSGQSSAKVVLGFDSLSAGTLSGFVGYGPTLSIIQLLASNLAPATEGLAAVQTNTAGGLNVDARYTLGSGWTIPSTGTGLAGNHNSWGAGGAAIQGVVGATGNLVFQPHTTVTYNSYDIYSINPTSNSSGFSVNFNGGTNTVVGPTVGPGVIKTTVTGTAASRPTCNLSTPTGSAFACQIIGIEGYNTAVPSLRIGNVGMIGTTTANWLDTAGATNCTPAACMALYAPNIVLLGLLINDANTGLTLSQWLANIAAMVAQYAAFGATTILWTEIPAIPTSVAGAVSSSWAAALIGYANANGIAIIDTFDALGGAPGYNTLLAGGWFSADNQHPGAFGTVDLGRLLGQGLTLL
jgi:hypothetical protein